MELGFYRICEGAFVYEYWYEVKRRIVYKRRVVWNGVACRPVRISYFEYLRKGVALLDNGDITSSYE